MRDYFIENSRRGGVCEAAAAGLKGAYLAVACTTPKSDIVGESDSFGRIHILLDGWACKYKVMANGSRQLLSVHLPGEVVDLDRIFQDQLGFGVMAITECRTASIPLTALRSLIDEHATIRDFLWASTTYENAAMIESICTNGRRSPRQGIAHLISDLLVRLDAVGKVEQDGFRMELRQNDIADLSGLSLVHVNRTMQAMRAEDLIRIDVRYLRVPDRAALRKIAEFGHAGTRGRQLA